MTAEQCIPPFSGPLMSPAVEDAGTNWRARKQIALVAISLHKDKSALLQRVPARCFVVAVLVN